MNVLMNILMIFFQTGERLLKQTQGPAAATIARFNFGSYVSSVFTSFFFLYFATQEYRKHAKRCPLSLPPGPEESLHKAVCNELTVSSTFAPLFKTQTTKFA